MDKDDEKILKSLQDDCRTPLNDLAEKLSMPKSTIYYRIKRLEEEGIIEGYHANLNAQKLGYDLLVVVNIRARFGPGYHEKIGKKLSELPGVFGVYFIYGESDFIVLLRGKDREELFDKMKNIYEIEGIERVNTNVVTQTIKEDHRIFFNSQEGSRF